MYKVKILADSLAPNGKRLTTFELTYPRFVHAEFMTHRMFSRNSASSRAIPIEKMIAAVEADPAMPVEWGRNQAGMQAKDLLSDKEAALAKCEWINARNDAILHAKRLHSQGVHKQIANRLLEPWMWITVICSATEFGNFFNLRCHPDAQPEIRHLAEMMADIYYSNTPETLINGEWHTPLIQPTETFESVSLKRKVSVGRCARVSYLTHSGERDPQADIDLCDRLSNSGHWSPFEHVATPGYGAVPTGNFIGWTQYRKFFVSENRPHYNRED